MAQTLGLFDSQGIVHLKYKSPAFFEERVKYHYPLFSKSESKSHIFKMVISFFFFVKPPNSIIKHFHADEINFSKYYGKDDFI